MRKFLLATVLIPFVSHANVIISATREIYPSDSKEISVQLLNNGSEPSLVQAWIDDGDPNSTPETANVPFLLMPPVVKVSGHSGQQLKVKYIGGNQAKDRESVFYLNVLDIPPEPENLRGRSVMQLAIKSRIKFFFRPTGLKIPVSDMVKKISIYNKGDQLNIDNTTPYYLTLSAITPASSKKNLLSEGLMISPFSQKSIAINIALRAGDRISVVYINDYGANISTEKEIK
ncbi:molecular chaperone [Pantoea coffeiphila]|uniref:fimbrial biogenesis chaperone n=1 Tax=Pantoea coffeiphila TaxID=1465635 RepID=UPI0019600B9A|nr:molecular chaperone [Pantoea coffeiphila]MBM7344577.1 P pilus assembly chaperone PapD [Pantoea coffeiphila]